MTQDIINFDGVKYEAKPATIIRGTMTYPSCNGCAFNEEVILCSRAKDIQSCIAFSRKDNTNIIWVKQNDGK